MKTLKTHILSFTTVLLFALVFSAACVRFNRTPLEQQLGSHLVSIRPNCDSPTIISLAQVEKDSTSKIVSYEFTCGDTKVEISDNKLTVNGKSYGTLNEGDRINVDYGKVRVNLEVRDEVR